MTAEEFRKLHGGRPTGNTGHEEDCIQMQCVKWFRERMPDLAPLLFHPNNEAYFGGYARTAGERAVKGRRAKEKGVTPGVADLILLYPSPPFHGLCIELKTRSGRQQPGQKEWQEAVEKRHYRYEIVRSLDAFRTLILQYTGRSEEDGEAAMLEKIFGKPINIHRKK